MEASSILGQTLGHYQVLDKIGAGGMGEVFRAHDSRLGRDVAVKVLPPVFSADEERLRRFEQEARATAKLNHPNILAIYDIGRHEGAPYIVSELLEGGTLRQRLQADKLSLRTTVDLGVQIARGLVAAHEKHIVHRDLKPENLFITREGRVKILDFGVAKLTHAGELGGGEGETMTFATGAGIVLGTAGYMSPEQVRGKAVDHRSDIFSFGAILYEMVCGKRAFQGETVADTITAILKDEPTELPVLDRKVPFAMQRIVRHCLEKDPEQRCQSARDLVFELETLAGMSELVAAPGLRRPWRPGKRVLWALVSLLALAAVLAVGVSVGRRVLGKAMPSYRQLTARRGTVWSARFGPDAHTIVYSASFNGEPSDVYSTRTDSPESRAFNFEKADLLAISSSGEMAVLLRRSSQTFFPIGTLARVSLGGGAPREVMDGVMRADFSPDGSNLAVARYVDGKVRLEYPVGKLLFETKGWIGRPRISPKGDRIAFLEYPQAGVEGGWVTVIDLQGKRTRLTGEWMELLGLAWSPDGDEVWFSGAKGGGNEAVYAVTLQGKERVVAQIPGKLMLHDIARDGSVLVSSYRASTPVVGLGPGQQKERDLTWLENIGVFDLTPDGKTFLFQYYGEGSGARYSSYVGKTDGSPAVRLGEGTAVALSPDGKWAATVPAESETQGVLLPTGAGETRKLDHGTVQRKGDYSWTPDSRSVVFTGQEAGQPPRTYVQEIDGGSPRAITAPGIVGSSIAVDGSPLISPDGKLLFGAGGDGKPALITLATGEVQAARGLEPREFAIRWSGDSRWMYVYQGRQLPITIHRVDLRSGGRELVRQIMPADPAGILGSSRVYVSADGNSYVYEIERHLSELYLAQGLPQ